MKTVTVDVGGLLSPLSVGGVEKQLAKVPGVEGADVNFAAGSATGRYDETLTTPTESTRTRLVDAPGR